MNRIGVDTTPSCICGEREDADHFLFECECYSRYRFDLVQQLNLVCRTNKMSLKGFSWMTLLGQDRNLGKESNLEVVRHVLAFIKKAMRFKAIGGGSGSKSQI